MDPASVKKNSAGHLTEIPEERQNRLSADAKPRACGVPARGAHAPVYNSKSGVTGTTVDAKKHSLEEKRLTQQRQIPPQETRTPLQEKQIPLEEKFSALLRQHGRGLLVLLVAVLMVHDIFGTHGYLAMRRTEVEIKKVQTSLGQLTKENEELEQEVKDLKSDPRLIEKIARDDLGLARPGETIIRIPQGQQLGQEPTGKR